MLVRVALFTFSTLLAAPCAHACTCLCNIATPPINWESDATYIFRGEVLSVDPDRPVESPRSPIEDRFDAYRMKVTKLAKGEPEKIISLRGPAGGGGACGVGFRKGQTYNVVAFRQDDGHLWTSQCNQYCASNAGVFKSLEGGQ